MSECESHAQNARAAVPSEGTISLLCKDGNTKVGGKETNEMGITVPAISEYIYHL